MTIVSEAEFDLSHHHISKQYDHELLAIRNRVLTLGGLVEAQIEGQAKAHGISRDQVIRDVLTRPRDAMIIASDVAEMRRAIAQEKGEDDVWDLKYAAGGMVDIDRPELAPVDAALDHRGQRLLARPDHFVDVEARDLREIARLREDQLRDARDRRWSGRRSGDAANLVWAVDDAANVLHR